eukprot:g5307.t1
MTNGGGHVEAERAASFTEKFGVEIFEHQICQSHTPMKQIAMNQHKDEVVLLVGKRYEKLKKIAASYGFQYYITVEELHDCFPLLYPDAPSSLSSKQQRQQLNKEWLNKKFGAVIAMTDPLMWGRELQICCDVLRASGPGTPESVGSGQIGRQQTIPLYSGCADFEYAAEFPVPRFGAGSFMFALQATYKELTGQSLKVEHYGKPLPVSYDYVKGVMDANMASGDTIERAFMIGDNPDTDIKGAKLAGYPWFSVLTRSGMWKEGDDDGGADIIVDDVGEAMKHIFQFEKKN